MSHIFKTAGISNITDIDDASKSVGINLSSATTGTTTNMNFLQTTNRTWSWPDATSTIVGTDISQTITNKTIYEPSSIGITASGSLQGTATLITNTYNIITTTPLNGGVILPAPGQAGLRCVIVNKGLNTLNIYPNVGGIIDSLATNAPFTLQTNASITIESASTTQWYTIGSFGVSSGGVTSLTGTANQITASQSTGAVTVSTPTTFIAPGTIQDTSGVLYSTNSNVSASGIVQGTATLLTKSYNVVTTVGSGTGVILPTPSTGGYVCVVVNKGANILRCYPNSGGQIDSLGINIAYQLGTNSIVEFRASTTTQWYSFGGVTPGSGLSSLLTEVNSSSAFTTNSVTDVLITTMTYTVPIANPINKCLVIFNGSGTITSNGTAIYSVYYNNVIVPNSSRSIQPPGNGSISTVATQALVNSVTVGGVIEIRVRATAGTVTVQERSMAILGVA